MARKRIRLGLNDLPDSLLIFILSKISFKQAVRCSVLSKRWKFFWTVLPNLKFSTGDFSASSCSRAVDNIFKLHSGLLERFEFNKSSCTRRSRDKICEWISYAALKDVRELSIEESTSRPYEVPISIFLCQSLRFLALSNFLLTNMPDSFAGFAGLATLNLYNVELKRITTLKSVRNITLLDLIRKYEVKILREFPDLEQLCFDTAGCSSSDFSYWEYLNSFSKFSATFSLENLKRVHLNMTIFYDPTPLLTCLLPRAPAMKTLLVSRKKGFKSIKARQFLNRLGNFQREYTEIEILLSRNTLKEGRCLSCEF
ncbi:hypothetical protein SUGI_0346900 [Cryptomeria japonica]|nr:hypothetical protein SUGI_0346900 [Cryptomeria japonica]